MERFNRGEGDLGELELDIDYLRNKIIQLELSLRQNQRSFDEMVQTIDPVSQEAISAAKERYYIRQDGIAEEIGRLKSELAALRSSIDRGQKI